MDNLPTAPEHQQSHQADAQNRRGKPLHRIGHQDAHEKVLSRIEQDEVVRLNLSRAQLKHQRHTDPDKQNFQIIARAALTIAREPPPNHKRADVGKTYHDQTHHRSIQPLQREQADGESRPKISQRSGSHQPLDTGAAGQFQGVTGSCQGKAPFPARITDQPPQIGPSVTRIVDRIRCQCQHKKRTPHQQRFEPYLSVVQHEHHAQNGNESDPLQLQPDQCSKTHKRSHQSPRLPLNKGQQQ